MYRFTDSLARCEIYDAADVGICVKQFSESSYVGTVRFYKIRTDVCYILNSIKDIYVAV